MRGLPTITAFPCVLLLLTAVSGCGLQREEHTSRRSGETAPGEKATVSQASGHGKTPVDNMVFDSGSLLVCGSPQVQALTQGRTLYAANCASCHGPIATTPKGHATVDSITAAIQNVSQMHALAGSLGSTEINLVATALADPSRTQGTSPTETCTAPPQATNFTRSLADVIQIRVKALFPTIDTTALIDPTGIVGQALGNVDFISAFAETTPTTAGAQNAFRKAVIASACSDETKMSALFTPGKIALDGESPPTDPDLLMAWTVARNVWLVPFPPSAPEVQALLQLIQSSRRDGATDSVVKQSVCSVAMAAPQFWLGTNSNFDVVRRIALDIGHRLPTSAEFSDFNQGKLTISQFVRNIQKEPGYLEAVKSWHRRWLAPSDFSKQGAGVRGYKYWWSWGGAADIAGLRIGVYPPAGALDPGIAVVKIAQPNIAELSDTANCQPFVQNFDPTTQRIQWEQKVANVWYVIGGYKLVSGTWQKFGGSVPVNGVTTPTTLADVVQASASVSSTTFHYTHGALASLPQFSPSDRRLRRFTQPDDIDPNAASDATEQNGYSLVKLWWSGQPVYVCNAFERFPMTCALRNHNLATGAGTNDWTAELGTLPLFTNNAPWVGVDYFAHPAVLEKMACSFDLSKYPTATTLRDTSGALNLPAIEAAYSNDGPPNDLLINGEVGGGSEAYAGIKAEHDAVLSVFKDMSDEPVNLVASIVADNLDYRQILTADWTMARGPLDLLYRTQGQYLVAYPPGLGSSPGQADYMQLHRVYPMQYARISRAWFTNSSGADAGGQDNFYTLFNFPMQNDLPPRPISGVLTQSAFMGSGGSKMRSIAAKIWRTFTCSDLNGFAPSAAEQSVHTPFIPVGEKGGAQHVDPKAGCFKCHYNLDPLASALSKGYLLKNSLLDGGAVNGGGEWLAAYGELSPFETEDAMFGFHYGIRGNLDQPSQGAMFGHEVSGVRGVGQALAQSPQFATCAVTQAFSSVFGRMPSTDEDQSLISSLVNQWPSTSYSYNKLIELLVTSQNYLRRD